jgi:DNA polymerase-3 subunit gamma/tau
MAEYQVIARKWRPRKFSEVIGQEHVIRTLQNELVQGRTAHAYLFVGPRGIGKTTIARIFAKALNCKDLTSGEPCCKCSSCVSIGDASSLDVIEIDAASNNSVDNARSLCEEVLYAPVNSRYKVYIIDEVHMLSTQAWNALLKTVEEPPAHVKFLFATTEAHKVLPTIVSRCQRFDLMRISTKLISDNLVKIAEVEKVKVSKLAIDAIARAADGGMRDAQSLLDQMISFFSSDSAEISEENVLSVFGLTGEAEMESLISAILNNDKATLVLLIHLLSGKGKNLEKLFDDLLFYLRGVELCKILPDPSAVLETGEESVACFRKLGKDVDLKKIEKLLEMLSPAGRILHDAINKQVFIESIILKAMRYSHSVQIEELIAKLSSLDSSAGMEALQSAMSVQQPVEKKNTFLNETPASTHITSVKEAPAPYIPPSPQPQPPPIQTPEPKPVPSTPSSTLSDSSTPALQNSLTPELTHSSTSPTPSPTYTPTNSTPSTTLSDSRTPALQNSRTSPTPSPTSTPTNSTPSTTSPNSRTSPVSPTSPNSPTSQLGPDTIWHKIISEVELINKPILKNYMQEGIPDKWEKGTLTILFDQEFEDEHVEFIKRDLHTINNCLYLVTGIKHATVKVEKRKGIMSPHELPRQNIRDIVEVKNKVKANQYVKNVLDLFDGEIVDVRG